MKNMLLILNPKAGKKQGLHALAQILGLFQEADYLPSVLYTRKSGDATDFVSQYGVDKDLIVCIGGDGTFNEVIAGEIRNGLKIPIGYIPAGSTNDFAASLHIPTNPLAAANAIIQGTAITLDAGVFNGRFFSYVASFGAFTKTSYSTPQELKNTLGHLAYLLQGVKDISTLRSFHLSLHTDTLSVEDDFIFGAISNATSIGGILHYQENEVNMNDGLLEMLLIRNPKNFVQLNSVLQALATKRYTNNENIVFCTAHRLDITADPQMEWSLDGERQEGAEKIVIENIPNAIQLMLKK